MTILTQVSETQAQKATTVNENFVAVAYTGLFGRRAPAIAGLTWAYFGGLLYVDGVATVIADGTVALTNAATNYVEATRAGVVSANTTAFTAGRIPLYTVVTAGGVITSYTDYRATGERFTQSRLSKDVAGTGTITLTRNEAAVDILEFTGILTGNRVIEVPAVAWRWVIHNNTTGAFTLTVKVTGQTGVAVRQGTRQILHCNATDVVSSVTGLAGPVVLDGPVFIGDNANSFNTTGLTINQSTNDDEIISLKSSADVNHTATSFTENDTYGFFKKTSGSVGGLWMCGIHEGANPAMLVQGLSSVASTNKTTAANAPIELRGSLIAANTAGAMSAGGNLVIITDNGANSRHIFDVDAKIYMVGATTTDIIGNGQWYLNDSSNADITLGLTLNQGTNDDQILALKSSTDVAHGVTTVTETDTYGFFKKASASAGGLFVSGLSEGQSAMVFTPIAGTGGSGKANTSTGAFNIDAQAISGTGVTAFGANQNLFSLQNNGTTVAIIDADAQLYMIGTTPIIWMNSITNSKMTIGITIDQSTNDDEIISLKSTTDVAHGYTALTETETYMSVMKFGGVTGGAIISGFRESTNPTGLALYGHGASPATAAATSAQGFIQLAGYEMSGTGKADCTANAIVMTVRSQVGGADRTLLCLDEDGDLFLDGVAGAAFDNYHDAELIRAFDLVCSDPATVIRDEFDEAVRYGREDLIKVGMITEGDPENGGDPMWNVAQNIRILNGGVGQMMKEIMRQARRIQELEAKLVH